MRCRPRGLAGTPLVLAAAALLAPTCCRGTRPGAAAGDSLSLRISAGGGLALDGSRGGRHGGSAAELLEVAAEADDPSTTPPAAPPPPDVEPSGAWARATAGAAVALLLVGGAAWWCCCGSGPCGRLCGEEAPRQPVGGCIHILHAGDEASAQVVEAIAQQLQALGCAITASPPTPSASASCSEGGTGGQGATPAADLLLCVLTPTLLAVESLRAELAAFKELGVSVIPVHSGDQFPRDTLTPMISCSVSALAGCDIEEEGEEAQAITDARAYLFRENIRDVRNESHPEACAATLHLLAARASEVHLNRRSKLAVPAGHYDHDVFISYHARDAWEVYESISSAFEGLELNVFNASKDLQVTEVSSAEMIKHVKGSSCMVQVLTPNYLLSKWCRAELLAAQEAGIPTYVVYPSKKHTRTELLKLVDMPADPGSENEEAVNKAKAAIRRAIQANGVTDVYNPDFSQAVAEGLQAIALAALPKVSRRKWLLAMKRMLLCLLALVVVSLPFAYAISMDILIEKACIRSDRAELALVLALAPPVMSRSKAPGERCLAKLKLQDELHKIQKGGNVTASTSDLLRLAARHRWDWEMMHLVLTGVKDMAGNEPELAAANETLVQAVVQAVADVVSLGEGQKAEEEEKEEASQQDVLRDALDTLALLANADSKAQVMQLAPPVMKGLLEIYGDKLSVASRALDVLFRMAKNINKYVKPGQLWLWHQWYRALLRAMTQFERNGGFQHQAAVVLRAIGETSGAEADIDVRGIAHVLVQVLAKQANRPHVCEKLVRALVAFTRSEEEAMTICGQMAVEGAIAALPATSQSFRPGLTAAVMQLVNATATVPSCREHALQSGAVDAVRQGLDVGYQSRDITLGGFAALRLLAVDEASKQKVKVTGLTVVLRAAEYFQKDKGVAEAAGALLAQLAAALRDAGTPDERRDVLDLLVRLLQVHADEGGVKVASGLLNSTLQVVEQMAAGDPRHAVEVSHDLVQELRQDSKIGTVKMVVRNLTERSIGEPLCLELASFLVKRKWNEASRANAYRFAAGLGLIGDVASRFKVWREEVVRAVLVYIDVETQMLRERAEEAMVALNSNAAAFSKTIGLLGPDLEVRRSAKRRKAVKALVVIEEHSLANSTRNGLSWKEVDSVLRNASRGWPGIWQSIQDVGPKLRTGEAQEWLTLALDVGPAAKQALPRLILGVQRSRKDIRAHAADALYARAYAGGSVETRKVAMENWALVANDQQVKQHLSNLSRVAEADPDADMRVGASIALVWATARAAQTSPELCVSALNAVSKMLRNTTDRSDRREVLDAFGRGSNASQGECWRATRQVLRQRAAEDPSDTLRALANRTLVERYCPKQGCPLDG